MEDRYYNQIHLPQIREINQTMSTRRVPSFDLNEINKHEKSYI